MAQIEIVAYNSRWPEEFALIGAELRRALGDLALRIDHIGSTSVPGLAAKNLIDVQVTVADEVAFAPVEAALVGTSYTLHLGITGDHAPPGTDTSDRELIKRLFHERPGQRPVNIHVRPQGRFNQRYALLFRDYLRAHPASAAAYGEVKRRLAHYLVDDRTAYTLIKDPVCDLVACAAEPWAAAIGWRPGPSDA